MNHATAIYDDMDAITKAYGAGMLEIPSDCPYAVTDARMKEVRTGIAYYGELRINGKMFARFRNEGRGGCDSWDVRPDAWGRTQIAAFRKYADRHYAGIMESDDHLAGLLLDKAFTAGE